MISMLAMRIIATVFLTAKILLGWILLEEGYFFEEGASLGIGMMFCIVTVWVV